MRLGTDIDGAQRMSCNDSGDQLYFVFSTNYGYNYRLCSLLICRLFSCVIVSNVKKSAKQKCSLEFLLVQNLRL